MSDDVDVANERRDAELANRIAEHMYQLGHAVSAYADIEAETCNGCAYATKAAWGRTCDGWRDCRDDIDRKQRFASGKYRGG